MWPVGRPYAVLMVCTGNICRSPSAEAMLRGLTQARGVGHRLRVDSAGTTGWHAGEPPDPRSIRHGERRGLALQALRSRAVRPQDFTDFDLLLAMDDSHLAWLRDEAPGSGPGGAGGPVLARLLDFVPPQAQDLARQHDWQVPDPYYGGAGGFETVLDLLEQGCEGLLTWLGLAAPAADAAPAAGSPEDRPPGR